MTEKRDGTGQRVLLAHNMLEDNGVERRPPKQERTLNACGRQGGEEKG